MPLQKTLGGDKKEDTWGGKNMFPAEWTSTTQSPWGQSYTSFFSLRYAPESEVNSNCRAWLTEDLFEEGRANSKKPCKILSWGKRIKDVQLCLGALHQQPKFKLKESAHCMDTLGNGTLPKGHWGASLVLLYQEHSQHPKRGKPLTASH